MLTCFVFTSTIFLVPRINRKKEKINKHINKKKVWEFLFMSKMKIKTLFFINKVTLSTRGTRKQFCESGIPDQFRKVACLTSKQGYCSDTQTSTLESCQIIITTSHTKTWWLISRSVLLMGY